MFDNRCSLMQQPMVGLVLADDERSIVITTSVCVVNNGTMRQRMSESLFCPLSVNQC